MVALPASEFHNLAFHQKVFEGFSCANRPIVTDQQQASQHGQPSVLRCRLGRLTLFFRNVNRLDRQLPNLVRRPTSLTAHAHQEQQKFQGFLTRNVSYQALKLNLAQEEEAMQGKCTVSWYVLHTSHDYCGFLVTLTVDRSTLMITEQSFRYMTFRAIVLCSPVVCIFPNHEIAQRLG